MQKQKAGSRTVRRQGTKSKAIPGSKGGSSGKNSRLQQYRHGKHSLARHRARRAAQKKKAA
jgi:hypothetical protein